MERIEDKFKFLLQLNEKQRAVCIREDNILLKACPGSGKTRTLTYKLAYLIKKYDTSRRLNVAITYTNRAADEIKDRLVNLEVETNQVWAGTIHQFCLEFIIRPYTMYSDRLRYGYHIIDEYVKSQYITKITNDLGIQLGFNDNAFDFPEIVKKYQEKLEESREIDFDNILEFSFELVSRNRFICENIAAIIRSILIDEYQDTNELQYKILGLITKQNKKMQVVFIGDTDQAIYGGLGGVAKTKKELEIEFDTVFKEEKLDGCYRTTQRIVDFYSNFQLKSSEIYAVSDIKDEMGILTYNTGVMKTDLFENIANIVKKEIKNGVTESEICIIAPQWWLLFPLSNKLKEYLPQVNFDAPDITPIKYDPMNVFYLIARLAFTEAGANTWLRKKVANDIITIFLEEYKLNLPSGTDNHRILKIINATKSSDSNGIIVLKNTINCLFKALNIKICAEKQLAKAYTDFFEKIEDRTNRYSLTTDVTTLKQCFKEKKGVVISTFHGVKGEEYNTVIAFGILNGYIPHWNMIINETPQYRQDETKKLLYVVCSRAKTKLYLFSEQGRTTQRGAALTPTNELSAIEYVYDKVLEI